MFERQDIDMAAAELDVKTQAPSGPDETEVSRQKNLRVVAKGAGISLFGGWMGQGTTFLFGLVIARTLGAAEYGLYTLGVMILNTLMGVSLFGLDTACRRYVALARGVNEPGKVKGTIVTSLSISGATSTLVAVLLFFSSDFIASRIFGKPELASILQVLSVTLPVLSLTRVMLSCTVAFRTAKYNVLVEDVFKCWFKLAAALVLLVLLGYRLGGLVVIFVVTAVLGCVLSAYYLNRVFPLMNRKIHASYQPRSLLAFSLPIFGVGLVAILQGQIDVYMLGLISTIENVGVYKVALSLAIMVPGPLMALNAIFSPMIADMHNRGDLRELEKLFHTITRWSLAVSLPICLVLVFYAGPFLGIFGQGFAAGAASLGILTIGQLVNAATGPVGIMILMTGRPYVNLVNAITTLAISALLSFLLIPHFGMVGAAIGNTVGLTGVNVVKLLQVRLFLKMQPWGKGLWKPIVAGIIATGLALLTSGWLPPLNLWALLINLTIILSAYPAVLWLLGLDQEDRLMVGAVKRKLGAAVSGN